MAYRLKNVRYQSSERRILLQNENGPCPLLAAANALLLRGVITLPPECVRTGVASIDDVVNLLAERALGVEDSEHHLHELLQIFPKLQYGMDVNPRFTAGPTGVEYTSNLTAFDLLNVDLVHGWLLDPQDSETHDLIGKKSYNQLIELVIRGNEASLELECLGEEIRKKEHLLQQLRTPPVDQASDEKEQAAASSEETKPSEEVKSDSFSSSWVNVTPTESEKAPEGTVPPEKDSSAKDGMEVSSDDKEDGEEEKEQKDATQTIPEGDTPEPDDTAAQEEDTSKDPAAIEAEISELRKKLDGLSLLATEGSLINGFLSSSSHQLTHYGLHELYNYLAEESLSVFFRNNHFATVTKRAGVLYLLVTDLGYANVPEVMWEKLDGIDGDTEYVNSNFVKPAAQTQLLPASGPNVNPEQMLAQRGQSEADYQLALQLSKHQGEGMPHQQLDDQEGKLVAAATEASLREYNGMFPSAEESKADNKGTVAALTPTKAEIPHVGVPLLENQNAALEDQDRVIAMQLQAQMEREDESAQLARKLQLEENRRTANNNNWRTSNSTATTSSAATSSSCLIS